MTVVFHDLFWFLDENPFRTGKKPHKFYGKYSDFVDSGFVKTCDELVIGCSSRWAEHVNNATSFKIWRRTNNLRKQNENKKRFQKSS